MAGTGATSTAVGIMIKGEQCKKNGKHLSIINLAILVSAMLPSK